MREHLAATSGEHLAATSDEAAPAGRLVEDRVVLEPEHVEA